MDVCLRLPSKGNKKLHGGPYLQINTFITFLNSGGEQLRILWRHLSRNESVRGSGPACSEMQANQHLVFGRCGECTQSRHGSEGAVYSPCLLMTTTMRELRASTPPEKIASLRQ